MPASNVSAEKRFVFDYMDRNAQAIATLGDAIFRFAEPGLQETETVKLMTGILEEHGFAVERGISGFPTAFLATYGSGGPVIAMHTEYDANPNNSQEPGIAEQREIVPGAPGHCEGHNVNAAVMVAAALAIKKAMDQFGIAGTLKVFGAPAEELVLARPYFVRDGYFDDVDAAFHDHIWGELATEYGQIQIAAISAEFTFHGETAHAGLAPWRGRDALDAVVLMDMGVAQYREHMEPTMRAHRAITNGGTQPNVIPPEASVWWYFRDPSAEGASALFEQAKKIAEGAALMTKTTWDVTVKSAVWPVRANQTLAETVQRNIEMIGVPEWSEDEQTLARALQRAADAPEVGLYTEPRPLTGPAEMIMASNDCGDVTWHVPSARLWFPGNVPGVSYHHWTAGAALAHSIAHKGAVAGAKALAASVLDTFIDTDIVERAKETHAEELGDITYRPLLPTDQQPPLGANEDLMARFRPLLEKQYLTEKPSFD
ncbi:MAG: amidohydrolase [Alphaproteobacteria bacterium]|nr:amidohydrolase [Alphaproteobacteria bacterium]